MNLRDFRIGWRLLLKEPAYSLVTILGLAVGIAACFLLLGYVRHSFSYDEHVPERERVYQLATRWNLALLRHGWGALAPLPPRDAALASGQPLLATAFLDRGLEVRIGSQLHKVHVGVVDPDFEKVFAPTVLAGDLHAALARPEGLALTRETALRLFGRVDAVGKTLVDDRDTYVVAAVVADPPAASTTPYEALAGIGGIMVPDDFRRMARENWGFSPGRVYLKLLPGADPEAVVDAMRRGLRASKLVQREYAEQVAALGGQDLIEYSLMPLADAYLADVEDPIGQHGNRVAVLGLAAVAVLILLLAACNYVNLATVRTLARRREIAMRKVLGASAPAVARQFLAESVLVCMVATGAGLLLAWLLLPVFADLVQRKLDAVFDLPALAAALGSGLLLGLAAGIWPTWSALGVRAGAALAGRGGAEPAHGLWARRALTVLQFAAAMGLTATTLAVAWQTRYASTLDPGFDPAPLLMFPAANSIQDPRVRAFRDEVARLPGVQGVAVSHLPFSVGDNIVTLRREGGQATDLGLYAVSPEFFQVYGLAPVAGRLYDPKLDQPNEPERVVVNASAARKLGFASAADAVGKTVASTAGGKPMQVVGVAPDIRHRSARSAQKPAVFYLRDRVGMFTVRCDGAGNVDAVRRAIEAAWPRYFPNESLGVLRTQALIDELFYADDLRLARLLAAASVTASAIAAFGIYVLAAYSVRRREKEIVLRKLYGAGVAAIGKLVAREFAALVGAGALLGLPLAYLAIQRWLGAFTERAPIGAWTLAAALLALGIVALAATLRHALAALRIRPALALRE